ncbi:MAG: molybdenum cofactor guanylyltransferase [Gammaproteobacteria bacterium]
MIKPLAKSASIRPSGLILAGGQSRRFSGNTKALLLIDGETMISLVARHLAAESRIAELIISSNTEHAEYSRLADAVISDQIGDHWGPLAGLHSGLTKAASDWMIVAACDQPLLPPWYVSSMVAACNGRDIVLAVDDQRQHFLNLLLPTRLQKSLHGHLVSGGRRVQQWIEQVGYTEAKFAVGLLDSVNRPEELERIRAGSVSD